MADKASQGRDDGMIRAAAELALSALTHAQALNPQEITRALEQCREQNTSMLERACNAVSDDIGWFLFIKRILSLKIENAAKEGGVYPETLFIVLEKVV